MIKHYFIFSFLIFMFLHSCSVQNINLNNTFEANKLGSEYLGDIKKSDKIYKGKFLTVSGTVWQSYTNKYNEKIIILMQKDKSAGVKCILNPSAKQMDRPLKQGEILKINGKCQGFDDHVVLVGCFILNN